MTQTTKVERALGEIRNLYWHIRQLRPFQSALRRKLYREVVKRKCQLIEAGVDSERLRLFCRALASKTTDSDNLQRLELNLVLGSRGRAK